MRSLILCVITVCITHSEANAQFLRNLFRGYDEPLPVCRNGVCNPPANSQFFMDKDTGVKWIVTADTPDYVYTEQPTIVYHHRRKLFAFFRTRENKYDTWQSVENIPVKVYKPAIDAAEKLNEKKDIGTTEQKLNTIPKIVLPKVVDQTPIDPLQETKPKSKVLGTVDQIVSNINNAYIPQQELPTGVDHERLSQSNSYLCNGNRCTKNNVIEYLTANIADQSNKKRITLIGSESDCKKVLDSLPVDTLDWAVIKSYAPDDWYVKSKGFKVTGTPVIYIQEPDGTIIHRQDDAKGADKAVVRGAPGYDPSKDPDLRINGGINNANLLFGFNWWHVIFFVGGIITAVFGPRAYKIMYNTLNMPNNLRQEMQQQQAQNTKLFAEMIEAMKNNNTTNQQGVNNGRRSTGGGTINTD